MEQKRSGLLLSSAPGAGTSPGFFFGGAGGVVWDATAAEEERYEQ